MSLIDNLPEPYPLGVTGPRLTFTAGPDVTGSALMIEVDRAAPADRRDRAICRALLTHALYLLDAADS